MKLTLPELKTFHPVKYFKDNYDRINSLSYTDNGEAIISSSDDDQMIMYDCTSGSPRRTINSRKYGVNLIQFTHSSTTAIHASTKVDDTIRYLSLHDNKYIRYFQSHTDRVVSLSMSPVDDTFLSGALDGTVRLWDLRSPNCHGVMHVPGRPAATFDPEGLIFAAGINSECLKLYDLRSFDKGPFATFKLPPSPEESQGSVQWTRLKFSPDGKTILICTNGNSLRLVDAYNGLLLHSFKVGNGSSAVAGSTNGSTSEAGGHSLDACFTPTSSYVLSTSPDDACLQVWSVETGLCVIPSLPSFEAASASSNSSVPGSSSGGVLLNCVAFNPRFAMLATGSNQTSFWLPNMEELE